jgi:8-oxo-dGTP pyrophosphatase MutT (NUDIX family)
MGILDRFRSIFMGFQWHRPPGQEPTSLQYGAIPFRRVGGEIQFMMITSRRTRRWIFPKGNPIEGLSPAQTAAEEAFEEAGVRGTVGAAPIGHYHALRSGPAGATTLSIEMYPLVVDEQLDQWPEMDERQRQWVTLAQAQRQLSEPDLVAMAELIAGGDTS